MNMRKLLTGSAIAAAAFLAAAPAQAQDFYLGQIVLVGFPYCPEYTVEANGQILQVSQYQALYSLYGNQYGGTAGTSFGLPDLRGRRVVHVGQGPGLLAYQQAQKGGAEATALTLLQLPAHSHSGKILASSGAPNADNPAGGALADFPTGVSIYNNTALPATVAMSNGTIQTDTAGSSQPFSLLDPYLVLRYCVVTTGLYPVRPS
ncbi:MAG: tail fiber protein [Sphingomonas sp.]